MSEFVLTETTRIERPAAEVIAWLARPGVIARLRLPWANSSEAAAQPTNANANACPCEKFLASTRVAFAENGACVLTTTISSASESAHAELKRALVFRHTTIRADIEACAAYGAVRRMRIVVAGASGMIGRALVAFLQTQGHDVACLVRDRAQLAPISARSECRTRSTIFWDPANGVLDPAALHGVDAVINLAGENIAAQPWTQARRDVLWQSRIGATRTLVGAFSVMQQRPFVLVNASASGFYGTRGAELLSENAPSGTGFLAALCAGWEHEAAVAAEVSGVRVASVRFGIVLTPEGGALAQMLPWFRRGQGGKLGHGGQWLSWISIDDAIGAIYHAVLSQACSGPVNLVSPEPVQNSVFADELAAVLGKRALIGVPRWALRLRYGIDFANETLLASVRAEPTKLRESGYRFRHAQLREALAYVLGVSA